MLNLCGIFSEMARQVNEDEQEVECIPLPKKTDMFTLKQVFQDCYSRFISADDDDKLICSPPVIHSMNFVCADTAGNGQEEEKTDVLRSGQKRSDRLSR